MAKQTKTPAQAAAEFKAKYGYDKEKETKEQAFVRLVNARLNNALTAIRLLETLANKATYAYTPEQVAKMEGHLVKSVQQVHDVFAGTAVKGGQGPLI